MITENGTITYLIDLLKRANNFLIQYDIMLTEDGLENPKLNELGIEIEITIENFEKGNK